MSLSFDDLPALITAACDDSGEAGRRVDLDGVMLRLGTEDEVAEYAALLIPHSSLAAARLA